MLKIAFIGCVQSSEFFLQHLLTLPNVELVAVVTAAQSAVNADFVNLGGLAQRANIPCLSVQPKDSAAIAQWLAPLRPDVIYCFGWSYLLSEAVLTCARLGVIGYHCTALPKNRGRHPLIWTLALGLDTTASTFFFMDEGADSGDILSQEIVYVDLDDDANTLYQKLLHVGKHQITAFTAELNDGSYSRIAQDHQQATYWRKRSARDGQIDWRMSAQSIHNLVRALTQPYVGAHCVYRSAEAKIWKTQMSTHIDKHSEPGKVLAVNGQDVLIKCGEGVIQLLRHELLPLPTVGEYL